MTRRMSRTDKLVGLLGGLVVHLRYKFAVFSRSVDGSPMKAEVMYIGRQEASLDYWDGEGNDT